MKLPVISGAEAMKAFRRIGYVLDEQEGSHRDFQFPITESLPREHFER